MSAVTALDKSYCWWREHGETWPGEMARRLGRHPYYHIQQILLADLIGRSAPARVLELGCGFGRHQAYLADIPGITLFGADQSAAMLAAAPRAAGGTGVTGAPLRLVRNDPLAGLPFRDKAFDVAFTVNALRHVPPRDIEGVVAELSRVTRGRILHFEPARTAAGDAHARLEQVLASRTWRWGIRLARTPLGRMADRLLRALGR